MPKKTYFVAFYRKYSLIPACDSYVWYTCVDSWLLYIIWKKRGNFYANICHVTC